MTIHSRYLAASAALLACACTSAPQLSITAPLEGAQLTAAADLDPTTPGIQIAVDATTSASDGSQATAWAGGPIASAQVSGGHLHFDAVTLVDGPGTIYLRVVDKGSRRWAVNSVRVLADSLAQGCRFTGPADHTVVVSDPGDTGFVSQQVDVLCRGIAPSTNVGLTVGDSAGPLYNTPLGADGKASLNVALLPGVNLIGLIVAGAPLKLLTVTLQPPAGSPQRCTGRVLPADGTSFNLAGGGGAVADTDPATVGMQARLSIVEIPQRCEGEPVRVTVSAGGARPATYTGLVTNGTAQLDVTLPEPSARVEAFVGKTGGAAGALRPVNYAVDSIAPTAVLTLPLAGQSLGDADNVSPLAGVFKGRFVGVVTDVSAANGDAWYLLIDEGTAAAQLVPLVGATLVSGHFSIDRLLANGPHTARVQVVRKSGNAGSSVAVRFAVAFYGGSLAFTSPANNASLGLGQVVAQPGGANVSFGLRGTNLGGFDAVVTCTPGAGGAAIVSAPGRLDAGGNATITTFLPLTTGCAPIAFSCGASATPPGGSRFDADPITITVDATPPGVILASPPSGSTRASHFDLHAQTGCSGEAQTYTVSIGGVQVAAGAVQANQIDLLGIALTPGSNPIVLTVTDPAGNSSVGTAALTQLPGTPAIAVLAPADGSTLGAAADLDGDLSNGLQADVRVQVSNRLPGTRVDLVLATAQGSRLVPSQSSGADQIAVFHALTLPEGRFTLTASVTDSDVLAPVQPAPVSQSAIVIVNTGRPVCAITLPADGKVWGGADDTRADLPGFQQSFQVQSGGTGNVTLSITPPVGAAATYAHAPNAGGLADFADLTLTGDGAYKIDAICATSGGPQGRALTTNVTLNTAGPVISFTGAAAAGAFKKTDFDSNGNASVTLQIAGGAGGSVALSVDCGSGAASSSQVIPAGGAVAFQVAMVPPGSEASCTLAARATTAAGVAGLPVSVSVNADRSAPAPAFTTPVDQGSYGPAALELDCTAPTSPKFKAITIAPNDPIASASGLVLTNTTGGVTTTVTSAAVKLSANSWSWSSVPVGNGLNTLALTATDAAGNFNAPPVAIAVNVRCITNGVTINLVNVSGSKAGYAQDKDHAALGEQIGVAVDTTATTTPGSAVRVCSTIGTAAGACASAGYKPIAVIGAAPTIACAAGSCGASFDVTIPEGPQQLVAEVVDGPTDVSSPRSVIARSIVPHVTGLRMAEDTNGDGALNQAELTAANGNVTFQVDLGVLSFVTGQTVQILSTASATVLGSAAAVINGPGTVLVSVPLASLLGSGGYQSYVFYAKVVDDAGNPNSIPGAIYPGDAATTLGTIAKPFVIAPTPTVSLTRPGAVAKLIGTDDARCTPGPCPGTDPLDYALSAASSAADTSTISFLLNGSVLGAPVAISGGSVSNVLRNLANGASQSLAVQVSDPYGNVATSTPLGLLIDSVPPVLTITSPAAGTTQTTYPFDLTLTATDNLGAGSLAGQSVVVKSGGTQVANAPWSAGAIIIKVYLANGPYSLVASIADGAGNLGSSAALAGTENSTDPQASLTQPPTTAGTAWFGLATPHGATSCTPTLDISTAKTPGGTVRLFVNTAADCTGATSQSSTQVAIGDQTYHFGGAITFNDGDTGYLCPQVTVGTKTVTGQSQQFGCDLQTPTVSITDPLAGQLYVADNQSPGQGTIPAAARVNQLSNTTTLSAAVTTSVNAVNKAVVTLFADGVAVPGATQTLAAAGAQVVKFSGAQIPIPAAGALVHTLSVSVVAPSGNSTSTPSTNISADVFPPAEAAPVFSVTSRLTGVVHVTVTLPGDDGSSGGSATLQGWDIRYSNASALTKSTWNASTKLVANLAGPLPTGMPPGTAFDLVLPTDQPQLWIGMRAIDRVGNLGSFTDQTTGTVVTTLPRASAPAGSLNVGNALTGLAQFIRVADVDGDGFDDVIAAYPNDASANGAIYIWFGGAGGLSNASSITLSGSIAGGFLGNFYSFEVADIDGDGIPDVIASESNCGGNTNLIIWTGASIKALGRHSGAPPAPLQLKDGGAGAMGGTIRAVGHVTGGNGAGSDLLVTNYTQGCGAVPSPPYAVVLPRNGTWLTSPGNTTLTKDPASIYLDLSGAKGATAGAAILDAASFSHTGSTSRHGLVLSMVNAGTSWDLKAFDGDNLTPGIPPLTLPKVVATWSTGIVPALPGSPAATSLLGLALGGGDVVGDATTDVLVAYPEGNGIYVYDGATLLSGSAPIAGAALTVAGTQQMSRCAVVLPDLDGDGHNEFTGCNDTGLGAGVVLDFGFLGTAAPWTSPTSPVLSPTWSVPAWASVSPARSQVVLPNSGATAYGQSVGAGHVTSKVGYDLVVLSHSGTGAGNDTLYWFR